MSLKAFHVVFITASVLLAFGFAGWQLRLGAEAGEWRDLFLGAGALAAGLGLAAYERRFLRKTRDVSFL